MRFPKSEIYSGHSFLVPVHEDVITGHTRWAVQYSVVFEYRDAFWRTTYRTAATELQDEEPFEYQDEIECEQVRCVEKTVRVWEPVDANEA